VVLSIPKRLRIFFRYDRSLNKILFRAAWESLKELYTEVLPGVPGAVFVLQTAGESQNFNPHLHGCVSDGSFDSDGNFHPLGDMSTEKLCALFSHKVLTALIERGLITDTVIAQITSQPHTGFSAWWGGQIQPGEESYRLFLAGYIDRGPVANSRIEIDGDTVTYRTDKDAKTHEFDALEFLA
jgi:Putative transposase